MGQVADLDTGVKPIARIVGQDELMMRRVGRRDRVAGRAGSGEHQQAHRGKRDPPWPPADPPHAGGTPAAPPPEYQQRKRQRNHLREQGMAAAVP